MRPKVANVDFLILLAPYNLDAKNGTHMAVEVASVVFHLTAIPSLLVVSQTDSANPWAQYGEFFLRVCSQLPHSVTILNGWSHEELRAHLWANEAPSSDKADMNVYLHQKMQACLPS